MTDKERCDKCEFYEGPANAFQPIGYYKPPSSALPVHRNTGSCHVKPLLPAEVKPNYWCEKFKEQSL